MSTVYSTPMADSQKKKKNYVALRCVNLRGWDNPLTVVALCYLNITVKVVRVGPYFKEPSCSLSRNIKLPKKFDYLNF